jgi:salicylate hydroxylase
MSSRTILIAGAGIGGLTAALALSRAGFRVVVLEQAPRLEEAGAGLQLSPNASRILIELGLGDRLRPRAIAPEAIRIVQARSGKDIARIPLGAAAEARYGAPYWAIHRADLQSVLADAVEETRTSRCISARASRTTRCIPMASPWRRAPPPARLTSAASR